MIQDVAHANGSLNRDAFPDTPNRTLWSATSDQGMDAQWTFYLEASHMFLREHTERESVKCVRGHIEPTPQFKLVEEAGDTVVIDETTGFMWQRCVNGQSGDDCSLGQSEKLRLPEAVAYCENLVLGGHDDWHLPDRNEAISFMDYDRPGPPFDTQIFPNNPYENSGDYFLTTTPFFNNIGSFFCQHTGARFSDMCNDVYPRGHIRCLRDTNI